MSPPALAISSMNPGSGGAWKVSPVVTSSMVPLERSTLRMSPAWIFFDVFPDFKEREAYVDAVSVEDAGKGFCDDDGYAGCFDSDGCVFSGGAAAEVSSADHDVACFDFFGECRVDVDHAVGCEFFWIECVQVSCGDDDIGIDVVAVAPDFSF